ncbi:MAG: transglutaminase domain-containing protein [Myxococcota bacterium]
MSGWRRAIRVSGWAIIVLSLPCAGAQSQSAGPILHEPLPPGAPDVRSDKVTRSGDSSGLPTSIQTASGTVARPEPAKPGDDTPVYRPSPTPRVGLDRRTGADSELHYTVVFDPSVAPFKRELAFDTVRPDVTLAQSGRGLQRVTIGPSQPQPGRELFWGHVRLVVTPGERSPLPSVAPTSRVLEWQASPSVPLELWRDAAGNFSVASPQAAEVDLRFLMDAPSDYFGAPVGLTQRRDDPERPTLDPGLQARAKALWEPMGVSPAQPRTQRLMKLTEWFRSFEPGTPGLPGGDPLADLVLAQKGVCRHRSLGFLVMAHSLGIPAHYVMNDAHAFIEAWTPGANGDGAWQRIDLGGGSDSLELHAARNKHLHQPAYGDPFPRPPAYTSGSGRVTADGQPVGSWAGARQVRGAEQMLGPDARSASAQGAPGGLSGSASSTGVGNTGTGVATQAEARRAWLRQRAERLAAPIRPPTFGPPSAPGPDDRRKATATDLSTAAPLAWVGETLEVAGAFRTAPGGRLGRQPIEIWLIDPARPLQGRLLGFAVTDGNGVFRSRLGIPAEADLQAYDLVARFAGDARHLPSDSSAR